jgi:hypothetical protein
MRNLNNKKLFFWIQFALFFVMSSMCIAIIINYLPEIYNKGVWEFALRPAAFHNGSEKLPLKPDPVANAEEPDNPKAIKGAVTRIYVYEGSIEAESGDSIYKVPAGTNVTVENGEIGFLSDEGRNIPKEFAGTPFDEISAQFFASQENSLNRIRNISGYGFTENKVIKYNVDMLPKPFLSVKSEEILKGILEMIAHRLLVYRKDLRFSGKLFIGFVSRSGDRARENKVIELFKSIDIVSRYNLDNMLIENAGYVEPSSRLTISYYNDQAVFDNPALILQTIILDDEMILVYPWHIIVDLAVSILSINRNKPIDEQSQAYALVESIFRDLLKDNVKTSDMPVLLGQFFSKDIAVSVNAARQLALPAVQKVDFSYIEQLNMLMMEVARHA